MKHISIYLYFVVKECHLSDLYIYNNYESCLNEFVVIRYFKVIALQIVEIQFLCTMRKNLLNLYVLVWVGKKLLEFVKNIRSLVNFSKNFSLYSSDFLNVLVSISKNVMF